MSHTPRPTRWDESICDECGFPIAQHEILYGSVEDEEEVEIQREADGLLEAGPGEVQCARCGKMLGSIRASVWTKATGEIFYCHDNDGSCYVPATRESYPELRVIE